MGGTRRGDRFTLATVVETLSAGGLSVRLPRPLTPGGTLFLVVWLAVAPPDQPAPAIALHGHVVRVTPSPAVGGLVALQFRQHRFFYADSAWLRGGAWRTDRYLCSRPVGACERRCRRRLRRAARRA